jgi:hypothetical protein
MGKSVVTPEKTVEGNREERKQNKIRSTARPIIPVEPQNGANKKRACKTDHPTWVFTPFCRLCAILNSQMPSYEGHL